MKYTKVESVEHLKELVCAGREDFVRAMGIIRSSKQISVTDDGSGIEMFNYCDESTETYTWDELAQDDNYIAEMIIKGQLFLEE